jgi:5'(3')-deoxyribonucleotidase
MSQPVVMCDIDGVLADFIYGFTAVANAMYGTPCTRTVEQTSWNTFHGLSSTQTQAVWECVKRSAHFWANLYSLVDAPAREALQTLTEEATVYFVTSRPGVKVVAQTQAWLSEALGLSTPNIIVSKRKGEVARAIDAQYCLDDKAANASCVDWLTDGACRSFLLNRPYNQCPPDFLASGVQRVESVRSFIQLVRKEIAHV